MMIPVFRAPNGDEYDVRLLTAKQELGERQWIYGHYNPVLLQGVRRKIAEGLARQIAEQIMAMSSIDFETWRKDSPKETIVAKAYVLTKI